MARISLINIGHELLNGRITNTNASRLGQMLQEHGYLLARTVVIPDDPALILKTVQEEWANHDVVLMSGGLGPTRDDLTKQVLTGWWGTELVEHQPTLEFLYKRYAERGREMNELTKSQALAPEGAEVLHNPVGTAPGLGFSRDGKWLAAMPGVPYELFTMIEGHVLPRLLKDYPGTFFAKRVLRMANVSESEIALELEDIEDNFPEGVSMAYLPRVDGLWLEIKVEGEQDQESNLTAALGEVAGQIKQVMGRRIYAENGDSLPALLGEVLAKKKQTLSVAESLTGGSLAAEVVSVSGSSRYFQGSVTAYSPEAKITQLKVPAALIEEKTVVSKEVAIAMAEGVRAKFGTDFAISTTGWAEAPDENTKPGAWIGFAGPDGPDARWVTHYYRRTVNIQRTVQQALSLLLQKVI